MIAHYDLLCGIQSIATFYESLSITQMVGVDYIILIMFKPSLKRSKLQEIQLYTKTYQPPHSDHAAVKAPTGTPVEMASFSIEQAIIFPTSFFQPHSAPKNGPVVFNPLNYEWQEYPRELRKALGNQSESQGIQQMGCYKDLIWYYVGHVLHLWHRAEGKVFKYKMHPATTCVEIGEIQSSSLHFATRNLYIVGAGVANQFFLFGLDKNTLAMSDLKFNHELPNSRCIQKIKFVGENEIVVATDTSQFSHFDFTNQTRIACTRLPLLQRALPYLPLLYPSAEHFIEDMQVVQDNICTLVREEKPVGWITQKAKETLYRLMMKNEQVRGIIERKRIDIHRINRLTGTIELAYRITEEEFIRKIRAKHPQHTEKKDNQALKITSIYIDSQGTLSVVTKGGLFVSMSQADTLLIGTSLFSAPRENSIGVVGLCLPKRDIEQQESYSKENKVTYSQGLNGLTLLNDSVWFFSEDAMEPVKCDRAQGGHILSLQSATLPEQAWLIFTKNGYYRITRLKTYEIFLSYLLVKNELMVKSPEKSWSNEANFELFVENLAKLIGYEKICESLIDCLVRQKTEFKVAQPLLQMVHDELRGHSSKNYRDWIYSLSPTAACLSLTITEKVVSEAWKCLIELQGKTPKQEAPQMAAQNIHCNAYWYALREVFVKYSQSLLNVEPRSIKLRMNSIQESIKILEGLLKFFFLKKEREARYLSEAVLNRNAAQKRQKSMPRSPISKLKPLTLSSQKKEEPTESSLDQSLLPQSKLINESSTKLQGIISSAIHKLKTLITIFLYLADLSEGEQVGTIEQLLSSRRERAVVRRRMLARVEDTERLEEFSQVLPELQLGKALQFNKWLTYQQRNNKPEMANLPEIAKFITSEELQQLRKVFEGRQDSLADLLLLYWDRLSSQMTALTRRQYLESKQREIFAGERAAVQNQNKEYICSEMKTIQSEVQTIITSAIKAYIASTQPDYPRTEQMLNNILTIITAHEDNSLIAFAENQMANFGLAEKLILLRRWKKKAEVTVSAVDILTRKRVAEEKPKVERECLSNHEIYLLNTN